MADLRNVVITFVLGLSAAGAFWLIRATALSPPAPAQVVGSDYKVAAVETGRIATVLVTQIGRAHV